MAGGAAGLAVVGDRVVNVGLHAALKEELPSSQPVVDDEYAEVSDVRFAVAAASPIYCTLTTTSFLPHGISNLT